MFTWIFIIGLAIFLMPLIIKTIKSISVAIYNDNTYSTEDEREFPKKWTLAIILPIIFLILYLIFHKIAFYTTEYWWYESLGRTDVFWTILIPKLKIFLLTFGWIMLCSFMFMYLHYKKTFSKKGAFWVTIGIAFVISVIFGIWISSQWEMILLHLNSVNTGITDPLFNKDVSYYLFDLPLYGKLLFIAKILIIIMTAYTVVLYVVKNIVDENEAKEWLKSIPKSFWILLSVWCGLHIFSSQLSIYELMYSNHGVVMGVGYVDENVRFPMLRAQQIIFACLTAILLLIPLVKGKSKLFNMLSVVSGILLFVALILPIILGSFQVIWLVVTIITIVIFGFIIFRWGRKWEDELQVIVYLFSLIFFINPIVNKLIIPATVQSVVVSPREKSLESPYIQHNIDYTKKAFALTDRYMEESVISYSDVLTKEMLVENKTTIENIRILDYEATLNVLDNTQTEVQYYDFSDVDVDRYKDPNGNVKMYFVAPRDMNQDGLQSSTYINTRYIYGHGYGYVKALGNSYNTSTGYPILTTKGIPQVNCEPRIYYQEKDPNGFFYVNSEQAEHDYPVEDGETEYFYEGTGGVTIGNGLRKLMFAYQYDWRLSFGDAPINDSTRIMLKRGVYDRLEALCPFILWDRDAQMVVRDNGELVWIANGYSMSSHYPYSAEYHESNWNGSDKSYNFIRHSIKAVINSFNGTVEFYTFNEDDDPIISTVINVFPDMFKSLNDMPQDLKEHLIYPERYFKAQSYTHMKYHMNTPSEFYTQDKIWRVANENYKGSKTMMTPRYMEMKLPNSNSEEFLIVIPFTPKELSGGKTRDYLAGWMAGQCDPENFLKLKVYKYPKGKEVFGPWMIENQINTEPSISKTFTLLGTSGSTVWQGNLMMVPVGNTIISIEPMIVLAESDGESQLPSIRMVIAYHNKRIAWGRTTEEALNNLIINQKPQNMEKYDGPIRSVFDEYEVIIPVSDEDGNITSKVITTASKEEALQEIQKAIIQLRDGLSTLENAFERLQETEAQ